MPDSIDVLLLVSPLNPVFRPLDVVYTSLDRSKERKLLIPLQIGLLSIASYLRQEGFSCQYYDLCHFKGQSTLRATLNNLIKKYNPSIIGLTSYTSNFKATLKVISIIKDLNPNILICVGGAHVTFLDKFSIEESDNLIDVIVRGEGEKIMRDIVYFHLKGRSLEENVRGITTKEKQTSDQKLLSNEELNNIPPLAFDLIPEHERKKFIYIPLHATRGCSYRCTFCVNPPFWHNKVRFRDPKKVIEEILIAEELFPKRAIEFTDTILPAKLSHFETLVNQYLKVVKTPITMALTRANLTDNKRLILLKKLLQDKGHVIIGVENGSSKILKLMNKPSWEEQLTALKKLNKLKLTSVPSWMVGFCGEDLSTMNENLDKLNYLNKNQIVTGINLFIWIPTPGSPPFHNPREYGVRIHTFDWDYYDRAVFPPPYSLIDSNTGEVTLSNLQIWAYYLTMLTLQKSWSKKKNYFKVRGISIGEFMKEIQKNPKILYISPANQTNVTSYEDISMSH